jgi:hypothetical protein
MQNLSASSDGISGFRVYRAPGWRAAARKIKNNTRIPKETGYISCGTTTDDADADCGADFDETAFLSRFKNLPYPPAVLILAFEGADAIRALSLRGA